MEKWFNALQRLFSFGEHGFYRENTFAFGERHVDFTAENFLLSFSQPNFYFHAATTYDILRWKGVPIGKRDFMGKTRKKTSA